MNQQERLNQVHAYSAILATIKYDELMQTVLQNVLLVRDGLPEKLLMNSSDEEAQHYFHHRALLIRHGKIDEDSLRARVIALLHK